MKNGEKFSQNLHSVFHGKYESLNHKSKFQPTLKGQSNYAIASVFRLKYLSILFFLCER